MVFHQGNVETRFPPELDIATGEKIESRLLQPTLCDVEGLATEALRMVKELQECTRTLGYSEEKTAF